MITRRRFMMLSACAAASPSLAAEPIEWHGTGLGADMSLKLWTDQKTATAAISGVIKIIDRVERAFSLYDPMSDLSRLNRDKIIETNKDFDQLLDHIETVHNWTDGYFDPSVQSIWGARAVLRHHWRDVQRTQHSVILAPQQSLTFNGIAQGYATDLAQELFNKLGLTRVLINLGEYSALGGPFKIGISDPLVGIFDIETLQSNAIATTSPFAMFSNKGGHIVNPKNSQKPRFSTLSVVHPSAALADGLSTALVFATDADIEKCLDRPNGPSAVIARRLTGDVVRFS